MAEREIGTRAALQQVAAGAAIMPLEKFLNSVERKSQLWRRDRLRIVEQALLLLEMNYVHLPLKRAMHAINPIQRLKLLKFRLETEKQDLESSTQFHKRILEIFASLRDLHTLYLLPEPFRDRVAFLPFLIEQYFVRKGNDQPIDKYMVSRISRRFYRSGPGAGPEVLSFQPGVEVLLWNGVPIRRAIEVNGEAQAGSNPEARLARGLDNLTIRPLVTSLPPDESSVSITYRSKEGKILTLNNQKWMVDIAGAMPLATKTTGKKRAAIDIKKTKINQLRRKLYHRKRELLTPRDIRVREGFEEIFYAQARRVEGRAFGYIRLFSFDVDDPDQFVEEFKRVITGKGFPQQGLIIDVRGNGGGKIRAGERLLQLFTPRRIKPELFEFINSTLNLEICRLAPQHWELNRWAPSIAEAVVTGATYSSGLALNSEESCNDIGQVYHGPVILVTDALSYSTTDIFAAGFQDNQVGVVLGVSDNTGAGGANVWQYRDLVIADRKNPKSPFKPLPKGADLAVAVRRSIRVGRNAGRPLEELGITPDVRHFMTRRDLLQENNDLIRRAARELKTKPIYALAAKPFRLKGSRGVVISCGSKIPPKLAGQIAYLDVYVNDRFYQTINAANGRIESQKIALKDLREENKLLLQAFDETNNLVAAYRRII